jgi:hypothetical protein
MTLQVALQVGTAVGAAVVGCKTNGPEDTCKTTMVTSGEAYVRNMLLFKGSRDFAELVLALSDIVTLYI